MTAPRLLAAVAVAVAAMAAPAGAQTNTFDAVVEARSFSPIRHGDVRVDYRENSELNSRLARNVERALVERGFVVRGEASMLLDLRTAIRRPEPGGVRLRLYGEGGSSAGLDDFRVGIDLPEPRRDTRTVRYEVFMDLIDRGARRIVWTGKARAALPGAERFEVTKDLAERLVQHIGQTTRPAQ